MNLIGINGYIGSGKDTIGSIIQDLTKPTERVDLGGGLFSREIRVSPWETRKFAGKLKQIASLLTGIPIEKFEDQEFKKTFLPEMWNYTGPSMDGGKYGICTDDLGEQQMTVRQFLQKLGTEAMRDGLHTNVWVNALFADYKAEVKHTHTTNEQMENIYTAWNEYPKWIITDCRFPNEAQAIKDRGGVVVRVDRKEAAGEDAAWMLADIPGASGYWVKSHGHPSEVSLDEWNFDYIVDNNNGLKELPVNVKNMLQNFGVINL
jgi:hypothetical protein